MQFKSNSFGFFALLIVLSTACSKKAASTDNPGRSVDTSSTTAGGDGTDWGSTDETATTAGDSNSDVIVDDVDRGGSGDTTTTTTTSTSTSTNTDNILFTQYRNTIPTTKVCKTTLEGRSAATLKKFFNWDVINLEGPVKVCIEQESAASTCPNGENYCEKYVQKHVRIRIEYEDDLRFWYYDSEKSTNYAKLISYTGGAGSSNVNILLMDGAGFLMLDGYKTSTGAYSVGFSFADRPSYKAARDYDTANGLTKDSAGRRAATYADMKACATSAGGTAKFSDGTDCAGRFVMPYQFYADLNTYYTTNNPDKPELITDTALWVKNQITIANQYVTNKFPTHFTNVGVVGGSFGRLLLNGI